MFEVDKKSSIRMAPKLTSRHIDLPIFTSMNVKLAAQVCTYKQQ